MKKIKNKIKRKLRNRKKLKSINKTRFRISVNKSLKNLSAQIIDDKLKKTLVSASSKEKDIKKNKSKKIEKSSLIGEILAKRAKDKKISEDQCSVFEKNIQKLTDDFIKKIENILSEKEKEIIQI